jgi:hypothetical protein
MMAGRVIRGRRVISKHLEFWTRGIPVVPLLLCERTAEELKPR